MADNQDDRLLIYGAGGHAKSVIAVLERIGGWRIAGLIEDGAEGTDRHVLGYPVVGGRNRLATLIGAGVRHAALAVGDNAGRRQLADLLQGMGFDFPRIIHPTAEVLKDARIGDGTFVHALSVIGPDAVIGRHALISSMSIVGHDCVLGDFVQMAPGVRLGGGSAIGEMSFLGMGAVVLPRVRIGRDVMVAANSVVNRDVEDGAVVAGMPARTVRHDR